jgi:hypothetical protein
MNSKKHAQELFTFNEFSSRFSEREAENLTSEEILSFRAISPREPSNPPRDFAFLFFVLFSPSS